MAKSPESFMFTVGKLGKCWDGGEKTRDKQCILLGERAHLIEFPSVLLPPGATAGSIVNIAVHRNLAEEKRRDQEFWDLQKEIYDTFGIDTPQPPKLEVRNITQTSVTLEWPALHLATAKLRSLDIYRNGQRLAAIPQPLHNTSTKLSGLELNTDYTFQLVLRTSAGTFPSPIARVRTHTMADTSGISVCFGTCQDKVLLEDAKHALREMRAKWSDRIQIDTTHFVCTTPATEGPGGGGPGVEYQRALQLSIPVVQPQWILACHSERKMIPIAQFYLGATPNAPLSSAPFARPQSMSQVSLPRAPSRGPASPPTPSSAGAQNRSSMPPPRRPAAHAEPTASSFVNQSPQSPPRQQPPPASVATVAEADETEDAVGTADGEGGEAELPTLGKAPAPPSVGTGQRSPLSAAERRSRNGTMDRNFRFPPPSPSPPPVPPLPDSAPGAGASGGAGPASPEHAHVQVLEAGTVDGESGTDSPTSAPMEVPPPDPVEKEIPRERATASLDDDIGATEEISLN
ncbi:hypothetical protein DFH11DRAFT_1540965 [Phellopilus nigrolimitatus]|nr:hypothetical protein DFH11DRAFT_1540965 [Phellopilus nigrolimitatus]